MPAWRTFSARASSTARDRQQAAYARYVACTAPAELAVLRAAYRSAWAWGSELMEALAPTYGIALPQTLAEKLATRQADS
jgi:hypothetical protein